MARRNTALKIWLGQTAQTSPVLQPSPTPVGTPMGTPASKVIGAAGSTLRTADGRLTVMIPAGALSADTRLSVQPLLNTAHGGLGTGYRLLPEGARFAKPAQLSFAYDPASLSGSAPAALGGAFQDARGFWHWAAPPTLNEAAKTVSVASSHFSDWWLVKGFQLRPPGASVRVGQTAQLQVQYCYSFDQPAAPGDRDALQPLGYKCGEDDLAPVGPVSRNTDRSVNGAKGGNGGVGAVSGDMFSATYIAPARVPKSNPVAVSVQVDLKGRGKTARPCWCRTSRSPTGRRPTRAPFSPGAARPVPPASP